MSKKTPKPNETNEPEVTQPTRALQTFYFPDLKVGIEAATLEEALKLVNIKKEEQSNG